MAEDQTNVNGLGQNKMLLEAGYYQQTKKRPATVYYAGDVAFEKLNWEQKAAFADRIERRALETAPDEGEAG